jgi:hypothetical protein
MRNFLIGASALVGAALFANTAAQAAVTYVPIAFPEGAVTVLPFSINDNNIIAGGYTDSGGILHGFYGPPDGSNYTTFDFNDGTQPEARFIFNDGSITGLSITGFVFGEEFFRTPTGKIKILKDPNGTVQDGVAQGGNDAGIYVGDYLDTDGSTRLGFKGKAGKYKAQFVLKKVEGATSTNPRQINNLGVVAGGYIATDGVQHGFVLDGKKLTTFDAPNSVGVTTAEGINDAGKVSGLYTDASANRHAFVYDYPTGTYKTVDPGNGSTAQEAWGINSKGMIVGDTDSGAFPFIYCPLKKTKCPKGAAAAVVHPVSIQALKRSAAFAIP